MAHGAIEQMRALLRGAALSTALLAPAALGDGSPREPTLMEAQAAAARTAAGESADDRSRLSRARASHWAPVVRGMAGLRDDTRSRDGEFRSAPLRYNDVGQAVTWGIALTWDLPQAIFARDETQLAHAHLHLARARQRAATEAARLYLDRQERLRAFNAASGASRVRALIDLVRLTADLDARTGGSFHDALEREQAQLSALLAEAPPSSPPTPERR